VIYELIFELGGWVCHQAPERSLHIAGVQMPLCTRCTVLLLGAAAASLYIALRRPLPSTPFCLALTLPMAVEITLATSGLIEGGNSLRSVTGFLFGFSSLLGGLQFLARLGPRISTGESSGVNRF
jgi:uncharacterized membrane protein